MPYPKYNEHLFPFNLRAHCRQLSHVQNGPPNKLRTLDIKMRGNWQIQNLTPTIHGLDVHAASANGYFVGLQRCPVEVPKNPQSSLQLWPHFRVCLKAHVHSTNPWKQERVYTLRVPPTIYCEYPKGLKYRGNVDYISHYSFSNKSLNVMHEPTFLG